MAQEHGSGKGSTPMTGDAAARIQSATAKQSGGGVDKGSFAARAQSAAAGNAAKGSGGGGGGQGHRGGGGGKK